MRLHRCHVRPMTRAARYRWRELHGGRWARLLRALGLAAVLAALVAPGALAALPNHWAWLRADPATGVRAQLAIGAAAAQAPGYQNVYVSVGGSASLDIIQIGARVRSDGTRVMFAAWGRGEPNEPGSLYEERELGPVNRSWHTYELVLINGSWRMTIDAIIVLRVPDTFRTWTPMSAKAAAEAEAQPWLGGSLDLPMRAQTARTWNGASWVTPTWYAGGYDIPAETMIEAGADWMKVWR